MCVGGIERGSTFGQNVNNQQPFSTTGRGGRVIVVSSCPSSRAAPSCFSIGLRDSVARFLPRPFAADLNLRKIYSTWEECIPARGRGCRPRRVLPNTRVFAWRALSPAPPACDEFSVSPRTNFGTGSFVLALNHEINGTVRV